MISFDDFTKLDIRIGTILSAERVLDTDKLYMLMVDVGDKKPRQIISGIAEHVSEAELIGAQHAFIINLEPRVIRGLKSNGMILATGGGSEPFALLCPSQSVVPGSKIH